MNRILAVLAALALLVLPAFVAKATADGPGPTFSCMGPHSLSGSVHETVLVPESHECDISHGQLLGDIYVSPGSVLVAHDMTVRGTVRNIFDTGRLTPPTIHLRNLVLHGEVRIDSVDDLEISHSVVTSNVIGTLAAYTAGNGTHVTLQDSTVQGLVGISRKGASPVQFTAIKSTFDDQLHLRGLWPTIVASTVIGDVRMTATTDGDDDSGPASSQRAALICGTTIGGDLDVHGGFGTLELGGGSSCGGVASPILVKGALVLTNNAIRIHVSGRILGDAICRENQPHPRVGTGGVVVAGTPMEDCAAFPSA
jgi:hypothetical protein